MHTLQPHLCSTPVLTTHTSCTRRCAIRIHQDLKYLLNVRSAPLDTADGQRQRFTCVQSSSQPHVELDNEAASAEDGLITLDATVEALLTAETEAEGEELADFDVFESGHINQQELQQEENPYSPADAVRCVLVCAPSYSRLCRFAACGSVTVMRLVDQYMLQSS